MAPESFRGEPDLSAEGTGTGSDHRIRRLVAFLRRVPFTTGMLIALIVAGIYGRTHVGPLAVGVERTVGYSIRLFLDGDWYRLFAAVFFTVGGWRFYASLAMLTLGSGIVEYVFGTGRAWLTFFAVHVATLAVVAVAVAMPLAWLDTARGELLMTARDVGPSAGYYGCLGLAVLLVLAARLSWSTVLLPEQGRLMSADLAHVVAFGLGRLSSAWPLRDTRRSISWSAWGRRR